MKYGQNIRKKNVPRISRGFTLVELVITIALLGIVASLAVPSYVSITSNQRVKTFAHEMYNSLLYARSEAIKRNGPVYMVPNTNWHNGWAITTVSSKTYAGCLSDPANCLKIYNAVSNINISGAPSSLTFSRTGRLSESGNKSFTICDADISSTVTKRVVKIDLSGLPNIRLSGACS